MVSENLEQVKANIEAACKRVGRDPKDVRLVAVSKTKPISLIEEAIEAGQDTFGENKVQEMCDKMEVLPDNIKWHMIGHLQRNKVKYIAGKVELIHSVDSIRLAKQISDEAQKQSIEIPVLLEVNVAREESNVWLFYRRNRGCLQRNFQGMPGIRVKGFMTSAPFVENAEDNRKYFKKLYELAVDIQSKNIDNISMRELSMGMTGDYVVAVEEGATIVRVGTGIFGSR